MKQELRMPVKLQVVSQHTEEHNMKGYMNMSYKLKLSYKGKSYTFDYHDSVNNYNEGIELDKMQVLDMLADNFRYHDMTAYEIIDEFGDMEMSTAKAILKEAEALKRIFGDEDTIRDLKRFANGEDFNTEPTNKDEAIRSFNDDHWLDDDKTMKQLGITKDIINIELTPKRSKTDSLLLGETKDGDRVYIGLASFDCDWYYGFGYLQTYGNDGQWSSHTHFEGLNEGVNKNIRDALIDFFEGGKLTITEKQTWILCELMQSFYTLKEASGLYHMGGSHMITNPVLKKSKSMERKINLDTRKVILEAQKMLSPDGETYSIKDDPF